YFLWSSMPDDRLFQAAEDGELSSEEGLRRTVAWMLLDEKSRGLLDGFAEQWLATRKLMGASPSPAAFPDFDASLRMSMVDESKAFFQDLLDGNVPVGDLLNPGVQYLNDRLAAHYGLPAVGSESVIRVDADPARPSGILALGAWLTSHSEPDHSSPIKRGRWLSDQVLCQPVAPPPAGLVVGALPSGEGLSVRQQLELHRSDPVCAGCHSRLDVLGMGLEEFDAVGRLIADPALDSAGEVPMTGASFRGAAELAQALEPTQVTACMASKLYSYALGRGVLPEERASIEQLAATAVEGRQTLPELIAALVMTPAFRAPELGEGEP
ncbi:MAG: DUF1592 domain-containing protein, partial [Myxococcales bacterium]|nr:DUF1592 domain-containing protein [Myxococcales bacterium]